VRKKIQKWGNSLAIRIPKSFASEARIEYGSDIDLLVKDDCLILRPVKKEPYKLDTFLTEISKSNIHYESGFDEPMGNELI